MDLSITNKSVGARRDIQTDFPICRMCSEKPRLQLTNVAITNHT